jgi:hypothetical protein|tara:strand:- start:4381 stop:4590 length:210 start_codon:yes stop_codon:yes gene_type:complete
MGWWNKMVRSSKDKPVNCFNCSAKVKASEAFNVKFNTADGLHTLKACPACADDVNDVLKAIEEARNDNA